MLVQNNKKELKNLISCVAAVFPEDEVVGFDNPVRAMDYASAHTVDMCFADVEMKCTSGFALAEKLRNSNRNIRINLMSDVIDYAIDAWKIHVNDYIVKPVTQEAIRHTIEA
ncbi:MAG: response regulator [Lachnospiraceae bacterium]|nr:response regulator [Lachnospiraceae bacterium]